MINMNISLKKDRWFNVFFLLISILSFCIICFRSYLVPLSHDEAATFFFFIQSGNYMPFYSQIDANNHVLNSFLGNICFHLFGSSQFVLRLPNTLSFIVFILGVYKLTTFLTKTEVKVFTVLAFLFSFHWLTFFSACRGYGISMAFLVIGIAYMLSYIKDIQKTKYLLYTLLFFQLAISSNLILIIICLLLSGILIVIQSFNKKLFSLKNVVIWLLFFGMLYYWLSFSFFLQKNGALYYGEGDSYWKVTFLTLVKLLIVQPTLLLKYILVVFFVLVLFFNLYLNRKLIWKPLVQLKSPNLSLLFLVILCVLIIGFYAMHKILGINYPEDRTGLFYYVFFVLFVSFTFNEFNSIISKIVLYLISIAIVVHLAININFRKHSLYVYETIPEHFYTTLLSEQKKENRTITIGGHRVRELFFGYLNYRNQSALSPSDPTDNLQFCFDYYIGSLAEKKYWEKYYTVIDTEPDWGFVVLKRIKPLSKNVFFQKSNLEVFATEKEYNDLYHNEDTVFYDSHPLLAEVDFDVLEIEKPTNTWLVFAINDSLNNNFHFVRYPLQWSGYDLTNRKNLKYSITMSNLPPKAKSVGVFFWNIEKKKLKLKINSIKVSQLYGEGIQVKVP